MVWQMTVLYMCVCVEKVSRKILTCILMGPLLNVGSKLEREQNKIAYDAVLCLVYFAKSRMRKKRLHSKITRGDHSEKNLNSVKYIHQSNMNKIKRREKSDDAKVEQKPKQKYLLNVLYTKFFGDDKSEK